MRPFAVLLSTLCIFSIVGCGEDPNEIVISKTISILETTSGHIELVAKTLNDATAQAKKDGKPLDVGKIIAATQTAAEIKKKATELQQLKAQSEIAKETVNAEQRQQYDKQHKAGFQAALARLDTAERDLDAALHDADALTDQEGKTQMDALRETLKVGHNEFEVLTKRQS